MMLGLSARFGTVGDLTGSKPDGEWADKPNYLVISGEKRPDKRLALHVD